MPDGDLVHAFTNKNNTGINFGIVQENIMTLIPAASWNLTNYNSTASSIAYADSTLYVYSPFTSTLATYPMSSISGTIPAGVKYYSASSADFCFQGRLATITFQSCGFQGSYYLTCAQRIASNTSSTTMSSRGYYWAMPNIAIGQTSTLSSLGPAMNLTGTNMDGFDMTSMVPIGNAIRSGATTSSYAFAFLMAELDYGIVLSPEANRGEVQGPATFRFGRDNPAFDPSGTNSPLSKGAIVGLVVGGLVIVAAVLFIIRCIRRTARLSKKKMVVEGKSLEQEEQEKRERPAKMVRPMEMIIGQSWQEQEQRLQQQEQQKLQVQEHEQTPQHGSGYVYNNGGYYTIGADGRKVPVQILQGALQKIPLASHPLPRFATTVGGPQGEDSGQGVGVGSGHSNGGIWTPRPFIPPRPIVQEN
ncbi:hypothetical protein BGZ83_009320 [Gryganskiella cystojenkinii]|nr:hypothetical protein BGZ83_009320 [Gryganskiella cystojenkinii]